MCVAENKSRATTLQNPLQAQVPYGPTRHNSNNVYRVRSVKTTANKALHSDITRGFSGYPSSTSTDSNANVVGLELQLNSH